MIDFTINFNNIKALPFDKYYQNFTFIVNGKQYNTSRMVADILSPIIRNYHYQDPTISEFVINTESEEELNDQLNNDYFQDFLNLCNFEQIAIDKAKQNLFCQYFLQLGNVNEYLKIQPDCFNKLSTENVVERLKILFEGVKFQTKETKQNEIPLIGKNFDELINFAASHFNEIKKEKLKILDKSVIEAIISNESLQLDEENELLQFILDLYQNNHEYSNLFEYIEFENVNEKTLEKFINQFSIEDLSLGTWKSICRKLLPSKNNKNNNKRYKCSFIEKVYIKGHEFNGIMNYISNEIGGNIHENELVEIKSNSIGGCSKPENVVDYKENNFYESLCNTKNATICFDFKSDIIQVTNYSLKTSSNGNHLKNWVVEVSNDGKKWERIDEHINDSTLNNNSIAVFNTKKLDNFYRFVQLRQTGVSWKENYCFVIYYFDIFGKYKV